MAANPIELAAKIIPLNFTQDDLDYFVEFLAPLCAKIDEMKAREDGAQIARLKEGLTIDPNCPFAAWGREEVRNG